MRPFRFGVNLRSAQSRAEWQEKARKVEDLGYAVLAVPDRLTEAVTVIKSLLTGERVIFTGRHYCVSGHGISPLPVQRPHPPLLIGGNGSHLLALAAREADIVGFSGITFKRGGAVPPDLSAWRVSGVDERVRLVREIAGDDRFARLELNALVQQVIVTDERRRTAEELASRWTQLSADEILQSPYVLIGTIDQMVEDLLARRQRWGLSYYFVQEPYLDSFAPVIAHLAGK